MPLFSADLTAFIFAINHVQTATVIPADHNRCSIINTSYRTLCSNGWCLEIIHVYKFNSCSCRIFLSHSFNNFSAWKIHYSSPPFAPFLNAAEPSKFLSRTFLSVLMLSRLVDTFFTRTSWTMLLYVKNHSISVA